MVAKEGEQEKARRGEEVAVAEGYRVGNERVAKAARSAR